MPGALLSMTHPIFLFYFSSWDWCPLSTDKSRTQVYFRFQTRKKRENGRWKNTTHVLFCFCYRCYWAAGKSCSIDMRTKGGLNDDVTFVYCWLVQSSFCFFSVFIYVCRTMAMFILAYGLKEYYMKIRTLQWETRWTNIANFPNDILLLSQLWC